MLIKCRHAVYRIYRRQHTGKQISRRYLLVANNGLQYRCGVGDASGFNDDSIKPALTATRIAPRRLTQGLHKIRANGAANAAAINGHQGIVVDGCQQIMIQTHLTEFVDQHQRTL